MILRYQVSRIVNIYSRGETLNVNRPLPYFNTDIPTFNDSSNLPRSISSHRKMKTFFPLFINVIKSRSIYREFFVDALQRYEKFSNFSTSRII